MYKRVAPSGRPHGPEVLDRLRDLRVRGRVAGPGQSRSPPRRCARDRSATTGSAPSGRAGDGQHAPARVPAPRRTRARSGPPPRPWAYRPPRARGRRQASRRAPRGRREVDPRVPGRPGGQLLRPVVIGQAPHLPRGQVQEVDVVPAVAVGDEGQPRPSGEYRGRDSWAEWPTRRCASPPAAGTIQMSPPETNAISAPSGLGAGCAKVGPGAPGPAAAPGRHGLAGHEGQKEKESGSVPRRLHRASPSAPGQSRVAVVGQCCAFGPLLLARLDPDGEPVVPRGERTRGERRPDARGVVGEVEVHDHAALRRRARRSRGIARRRRCPCPLVESANTSM